MNLEKLQKALKNNHFEDIPLNNYRPSAVLVPILLRKKQTTLLLTQRSEQVSDHKKQICFPGGSRDPGDQHEEETALRETEEELGIAQNKITILGRLSQHFTPTRFYITPFIGIIKTPLRLKPNPMEINRVLEIPLEHFQKSENIYIQKAEFFSKEWNLPFYRYKNDLIWGVTGRIIAELISKLK